MVNQTFSLNKVTIQRLEKLAPHLETNKSEVIRRAVAHLYQDEFCIADHIRFPIVGTVQDGAIKWIGKEDDHEQASPEI